ncbi:MAG: hypothetical protein AAB554_02025 [Patescibacteria group bacterium]
MSVLALTETMPPLRAALAPLVALVACVLPTFAVILAAGLCAPVLFGASAFHQTEGAS